MPQTRKLLCGDIRLTEGALLAFSQAPISQLTPEAARGHRDNRVPPR
jgi:hypothetical protein